MTQATDTATNVAVDPDRVVPGPRAGIARLAAPRLVRQVSLGALQIFGFWSLNIAGVWIVEKLSVPIPGNLVGMALLYALLALGVVKLSWFEPAGPFVIRHLAFFFVPITVGLMDTGSLFATHFVEIMLTLAASAAIGIVLAGWISQLLLCRSWRTGDAL